MKLIKFENIVAGGLFFTTGFVFNTDFTGNGGFGLKITICIALFIFSFVALNEGGNKRNEY